MRHFLNKTCTLRILSALLGGTLFVTTILVSKYTFFVVFAIILIGMLNEFYTILKKSGHHPWKKAGVLLGLWVFIGANLFAQGYLTHTQLFIGIIPVALLIPLLGLYDRKRQNPWSDIAFTYFGIIYIAAPISLLHNIVFYGGAYDGTLLLKLFSVIWAYDIGAYASGLCWGKRPLWKRISPKKTWEGLIGGVVLALCVTYALAVLFQEFNGLQWLMLGALIITTSIYGDFIESWLKRSAHIKDSGRIIPGHGGFLDRFDSLLYSAPFIVAALYALQ